MRTTLSITAALALAGGLVVANPSAALACTDYDDYTPPQIVSAEAEDAVLTNRSPTSAVVRVRVIDPAAQAAECFDYASGVEEVGISLVQSYGLNDGYSDSTAVEYARLVSGSIYDGVWEAEIEVDPTYNAGTYEVDVDVYDYGFNNDFASAVTTLRLVRNAGPIINIKERVRRGTRVPVTFVVATAGADGEDETIRNAKVRIYFNPVGPAGYRFIDTRRAWRIGEGVFYYGQIRVTITKAGRFKAVYSGDRHHTGGNDTDRFTVYG